MSGPGLTWALLLAALVGVAAGFGLAALRDETTRDRLTREAATWRARAELAERHVGRWTGEREHRATG